ncbi:unnamed protein product [Camellia sinensis]
MKKSSKDFKHWTDFQYEVQKRLLEFILAAFHRSLDFVALLKVWSGICTCNCIFERTWNQTCCVPCRYTKDRSSVVAIGLNVHTALVEIREKLSIPEAQWPQAISELCALNHIEEAAVLSTCNKMFGTQGAVTGVGLSIGYPIEGDGLRAGLVVISAAPSGPANKAGILSRDVILKIDDTSTGTMGIYDAAECLLAKIIFGLNALSGRTVGPDGSAVGAWNSSNAESLIRYTVNKGYTINGWELGNLSYLDGESQQFSNLQSILKASGTSTVAWVGEAGGAYNSGRNLVTNAFVFSFWCLDQLGMAASYDTKTYCRQTLIGGNYGLLNTTTFVPNPDYYSFLQEKDIPTNFLDEVAKQASSSGAQCDGLLRRYIKMMWKTGRENNKGKFVEKFIFKGRLKDVTSDWLFPLFARTCTIAVNYWYDMQFDVKYAYFNFLQSIPHPSSHGLTPHEMGFVGSSSDTSICYLGDEPDINAMERVNVAENGGDSDEE